MGIQVSGYFGNSVLDAHFFVNTMQGLFRHIISVAALFCLPYSFTYGAIVINEVMQSNVTSLMVDNDFPDSWLELYNDGSSQVNILGWSVGLTDDATAVYRLPSAVIPAHGHLVVYCDKEANGLHTDFRIDSGKSSLYLFDSSGNIADAVNLSKMLSVDVAYGRVSDGSDTWQYELTPTPGAENAGGGAETILPEPIFSISGGLIDDYTFIRVTVPEGLPGDVGIFYTFDGSEPTIHSSAIRELTMSLSQTRVVRARLISLSGQALPSPVITHSFIKHPRKVTMPVVSIVGDKQYFYDNTIGILSSAVNDGVPNYMQKWRRPVNIEYFDAETGQPVLNQLGETAVSGVSTRELPQKSMKLYANKRFGTKNFKGNFWSDKPDVTKVKSFILRNGGNTAGSTRINDAVVQRICGTHMPSLDWQAYTPVIVYLNGTYLGLFGMRERSDEDYVESNYGIEDIEMADESSLQTPAQGSLFQTFSNAYSRNTSYSELSEMMDVDNFLASVVAEIYGQNTDFPSNNVSMWTPLSEDGTMTWHWILKDMDRFGVSLPLYPHSFDMIRYLFSPNDLQYGGMRCFDLYKRMISYPAFRNRFIDVMSVALGDFLKGSYVNSVIDAMAGEIYDEHRATFDLYYWDFKNRNSALTIMQRNIDLRPGRIYSQMTDYFSLGNVVPLRVIRGDSEVQINGVSLTEGDFDGSWFSTRDLQVSTSDTDASWLVRITRSGVTTENEVSGAELSLSLPSLSLKNTDSIDITLLHTATGVKHHAVETPSSASIYNLLGQRMSSSAKAPIVIRNGKKYMR